MLLVLTSYLWKSIGCFALLAGAYYVFGQWTRLINQIHSWLTYIFAVPPADRQQSTWPGEEDWPVNDDEREH